VVRNGKVRAPADGNWASTSTFLTPQANAALARACAAAKPGQPMPTDTDIVCADELVSVYTDAKTKAGEPGYIEATGAKAPLHRPDGSVVPDQQDRVY
jgi:hypothetical protein